MTALSSTTDRRSKMKVLNTELALDFNDVDQYEVYERENRAVIEKVTDKEQYAAISVAEGYRLQCRAIDTFFDNVFGKGTAQKVFHGKCNIKEHIEAFGIVSQEAAKAADGLSNIASTYMPNRAERCRAVKGKK